MPQQQPIDIAVYALFVLFGLGSWVTINGLFAELPHFYNDLPEKEKIWTDLSLTIQLANVFPLIFLGLKSLRRHRYGNGQRVNNVATYAILILGAVAISIVGHGWHTTSRIFSGEHSVLLIVGTFFAAGVDCTTSILFWPFAGRFYDPYVTGLAVGEGMSGVVASALTWIQTARSPNSLLFSVSAYFYMLAAIMIISAAAFHALRIWKGSKAQMHDGLSEESQREVDRPLITNDDESETNLYKINGKMHLRGTVSDRILFIGFLGLLSALQNGVSKSMLPYTIYDDDKLLFAITSASLCVDPIGAFLPFIWTPGLTGQLSVVLVWLMSCLILVVIAVKGKTSSTNSPSAIFGILSAFAMAFSKSSMILRLKSNTQTSRDVTMFKVGASMQIGAFLGSGIMFILVNFSDIFSQ